MYSYSVPIIANKDEVLADASADALADSRPTVGRRIGRQLANEVRTGL